MSLSTETRKCKVAGNLYKVGGIVTPGGTFIPGHIRAHVFRVDGPHWRTFWDAGHFRRSRLVKLILKEVGAS